MTSGSEAEDQQAPARLLLGDSKFTILSNLLDGERTAEEFATILDVNVSAVRGHMTDLESMRLVGSKFRRANVGRPNKLYFISEAGRELFTRRYDWFLTSLLGALSRTDPKLTRNAVTKMSAELANEWREAIWKGETNPTQEEKLSGLIDNLSRLGFRTRLERTDDGSSRIVRTDCALWKTAADDPRLICEVFDTALLESVLGEDVELEATMARGAGQCIHRVKSQERQVRESRAE